MVKAIDTEYNGYKFRSRLEARWAVFFDAVGCKYEYEVEGYELEDGVKYLPDFYLPEYDTYVEIKAYADAYGSDKIEMLHRTTGKTCIKIAGNPGKQTLRTYPCGSGIKFGEAKPYIGDLWFVIKKPLAVAVTPMPQTVEDWHPMRPCIGGNIKCPVCDWEYVHIIDANYHMVDVRNETRPGAIITMQCESWHRFDITFGNRKGDGYWWVSDAYEIESDPLLALAALDENKLAKAILTAKQARFEHGQTPNISK